MPLNAVVEVKVAAVELKKLPLHIHLEALDPFSLLVIGIYIRP